MKRYAGFLLILVSSVCWAKPREWKVATVKDVSETVVSEAAWGDTNIMRYAMMVSYVQQ